MRSIALFGRKRSGNVSIGKRGCCTRSLASLIRTPWASPYLFLRPRSNRVVSSYARLAQVDQLESSFERLSFSSVFLIYR
jgi:hypothetical protein